MEQRNVISVSRSHLTRYMCWDAVAVGNPLLIISSPCPLPDKVRSGTKSNSSISIIPSPSQAARHLQPHILHVYYAGKLWQISLIVSLLLHSFDVVGVWLRTLRDGGHLLNPACLCQLKCLLFEWALFVSGAVHICVVYYTE